ncbi:MAG: YhdP family protein [Thiotrichales bacterium]
MSRLKTHCSCWSRRLAIGTVLTVLAVVLLLTAAMPFAGRLDNVVEQALSQSLDRPVKIGAVEATWRGLQPVLKLDDVHVRDRSSNETVIHFDAVEGKLNLLKSLIKLRPFVDRLTLRGTRLTLVHASDDQFYLRGFKRRDDSEPVPVHQLLQGLRGVRLQFHKLLLLWDDRPSDKQIEMFANHLDLYAGKDEVGVEGQISLPQNLGDDMRFKAVASGPFERPADWDIDFYLRGDAIDLEGLPLKRPGALAQTESGVLDVEFWGAWSKQAGLDVQGSLGLYDLKVNEPAPDAVETARFTFIDELATQLRITGDRAHWRVDLDGMRVITPNKHWLKGGMSVGYDASRGLYSGAVDYADLGSVAALATLLPGLKETERQRLQDLDLSGDVSDLKFTLPKHRQDLDQIEISGVVSSLSWAPVGRIPGLSGLSAEFAYDKNSGEARLSSDMLRLNAPRLFRQPLEINQLQSDLALKQQNGRLEIIADNTGIDTDDFQLTGTARLTLGSSQPKPLLDLELISAGGDLAQASRYFPVHVMPPKTVKWLDAAFLAGRARDARITFNGPLSMPAFKSGESRFQADFRVDEGRLHYRDGWPDISGIEGEISFRNAELRGELAAGELHQTRLSNVKIAIPNLFRSELDVSGNARGPVINGIDFVNQTPIGNGMHDFLDKVSATGESRLALKFHLPLTKKTKNRLSVNGELTLDNAYLALPDYELAFEKTRGKVVFTQRSFQASGLQSVFRGSEVNTDISTLDSGEIAIRTNGRFEPATLLPKQASLINAAANGSSQWRSEVLVPARAGSGRPVTLTVSSDLKGIALALPEPLGKPADIPKKLQIEYQFSSSDPELVVTDQELFLFRGIMDLQPEFKVQRAGIGLSGVNPTIPEAGIRVEGYWPEVDYNKWYDFVTSLPESEPDQANPIDLVDDINVEIGKAYFAGQVFDQLEVRAQKTPEKWRVSLDSAAVKGTGILPVTRASREPWQATLEHLILPSDKDKTVDPEEVVNPELIPPLDVSIADFQLGERRLEQVRLVTAPKENGMNILEFSMKSPLLSAVANGQWMKNHKRHTTSLLLTAQGQDVGQVLTQLGFKTTLGSGKGTLKGQLEWDSVPYDLQFKTLQATFETEVSDGVINGVEPGLGRIIGLLSLDQLPRRLGLDFKDVSEEGFHYDTLSAKAVARNGILQIEHLDIDGSIASLAINGNTDLLQEQFDLALQLVPKFKSSVPIAAGLLAGPQVGVLAFIVDKLAEGMGVNLNESAALDFRITGSWDDPRISPVEPEPEAPDDQDLYEIPIN